MSSCTASQVCGYRVIKVAKDYIGEVSFAVSSKSDLSGEMQQFGLDSDLDVSVGLFDSQGRKYAMTDPFRYIHAL